MHFSRTFWQKLFWFGQKDFFHQKYQLLAEIGLFWQKDKDVRARSYNLEFLVGNPIFLTLPAGYTEMYKIVPAKLQKFLTNFTKMADQQAVAEKGWLAETLLPI